MSNKFFTLIHGESVHIAPKTKVLPAESFSTILDALQILESVKKDADKYRLEVTSECEKLKEQAQREGFEEGYKKWVDAIAKLEDEIKTVRGDMEKIIIPVALKASKKIVGREIEQSPSAIVDIVANNLKAVSQHKQITIYVNKKDLEVLELNRNRLRQIFEALEVLSIRERADVKQGGCIIETELGIINAQLDNQWRILENAFEKLLRQKETTTQSPKIG
jgi:type III secretion protein L